MRKKKIIRNEDKDRIIEMAWEDRTSFDAINHSFGLSESNVIKLMRRELSGKSFKVWRKRVSGRKTKHSVLRGYSLGRHVCPTQRTR